MKTYGGVEALDGSNWSTSRTGRCTLLVRTRGNHWIGGWVGPTAGMEVAGKRKIPVPTENRTPAVQPYRLATLFNKND